MQLSIVVNMYNTAAYMPRCMDSLLQQDIPSDSYEIILVNDGSTDNSLEIAEEYVQVCKNMRTQGESYPLIRLFTHENKGLPAARNTGIDAAAGKFLCFVDTDDYIKVNSLGALLRQMESDNLDILRFNYQKVDESYQPLKENEREAQFDYSPGVISGVEFISNRLGVACYVWAYIYRLDLIRQNQIRFYEGCYFDDTPWLPRVLQAASRVACTAVRHQYYLQRSDSMVRTKSSKSVRRQLDGLMELLSVLRIQMQQASQLTHPWYNMMIAHTVVSLLTRLSVYMYSFRKEYLAGLKQLEVFPLSIYGSTPKTLPKIRLMNFSPRLFCVLIHWKSCLTK